MMAMAPDYEHLPLINKVEVFEHALNETTGDDLGKVLWLKSRTSEVWLDRRTNYTRSLAVMSVVGYILGLGDRHPSNLMLDRHSGKILHIDFGDCFEASMNREKFPEKVPFRLTRMLVQAMGVSGVEGNYRSTCEKVMVVLRDNKDSAMAMLEAFVHDPLINWRLLQKTDTNEGTKEREGTATGAPVTTSVPDLHESSKPNMEVSSVDMKLEHTASSYHTPSTLRDREMAEAQLAQLEDAKEVLNERAVTVMKRLGDKLTGRDFSPDGESIESDSVPAQVQRLVQQATSHECLCQNYIGWCPFW
jgi:FKBP12-rapamycin complex-associated protein